MQDFYYVAEPDQTKAAALIRSRPGVNAIESVEAVAPLPKAALDGLNLTPGMFAKL